MDYTKLVKVRELRNKNQHNCVIDLDFSGEPRKILCCKRKPNGRI